MLIGSQSNFSCVKDEKSSEPKLEYVSTKYVISLRLSVYCEARENNLMLSRPRPVELIFP